MQMKQRKTSDRDSTVESSGRLVETMAEDEDDTPTPGGGCCATAVPGADDTSPSNAAARDTGTQNMNSFQERILDVLE